MKLEKDKIANFLEKSPLLSYIGGSFLQKHYSAIDEARDVAMLADLKSKKYMPQAVLIQISRKCNLRCTMCGWKIWKRNEGFMSLDLFRHILDEMEKNGIKQVNLTNPQGEPLLSPHAAECIDTALNRGFNVHINTNCTTLGEKNISTLVKGLEKGNFSVLCSYSGYDKESHESVYAGSKFEQTTKKLKSFVSQVQKNDLEKFVVINGIVTEPSTIDRHVHFLVNEIGVPQSCIRLSYPDNFAGIVDLGKQSKFKKNIVSFKQNLGYRSLRVCDLLAHYILIYDNGKVSACACRDSEGVMEIGDITKESLFDIRNSERYMDMLEAFEQKEIGHLSLCKNCDIPYGEHTSDVLFGN